MWNDLPTKFKCLNQLTCSKENLNVFCTPFITMPKSPLRHVDPHLVHECLGLPHSPLQTLAPSVHTLLHNYATLSPLVTMGGYNGTPQIHLKTAPFPSTIITPSNSPIPRPTPVTIPNVTHIHSAVLPQYTFQTDTHTHRPTDRLGDRL